MKCKTCGIRGHDSQGNKELCLVAVVTRCERLEAALEEIKSLPDSDYQDNERTHRKIAETALS